MIKQGMVTLPEMEIIQLRFGQSHDLFVAQENKPLRYYSLQDGKKLKLIWEKPLPEGLNWESYMYTIPSGKLIMSWNETFVFDRNLELLSKYQLPGAIRGMSRDECFVVCDWFTDASQKSGELRVSRRSITSPEKETFTFKTPAQGAYKRDDTLYAVCGEDGRTAIVAYMQCYVDFYSPTGQCEVYY